jgi:hypothetical protein
VILDALGSAAVWLTSQGYKFILKDADDNLVWTADYVFQAGIAPDVKSAVQVQQESPVINCIDSTVVYWGLSTQAPQIDVDTNSDFDTTTGRFTAPMNALYRVSLSLQMYTNSATLRANGTPRLGVEINGGTLMERILGQPNATGTGTPCTGSFTRIIQLSNNDYLRFYTYAGWSAGIAPTFGYSVCIDML